MRATAPRTGTYLQSTCLPTRNRSCSLLDPSAFLAHQKGSVTRRSCQHDITAFQANPLSPHSISCHSLPGGRSKQNDIMHCKKARWRAQEDDKPAAVRGRYTHSAKSMLAWELQFLCSLESSGKGSPGWYPFALQTRGVL